MNLALTDICPCCNQRLREPDELTLELEAEDQVSKMSAMERAEAYQQSCRDLDSLAAQAHQVPQQIPLIRRRMLPIACLAVALHYRLSR